MANGKRQFDPVAAAATSALDASQRSLRQVRSQMDAPELPAESQAFTGARNAVQSFSQFSPANVLARRNNPLPQPGQQMQNVSLPGMDGQALPQGLEQFAPQNVLGSLPSPQQMLPGGSSQRQRRDRSGNDGNGGSSGGDTGGSSGGSGSSSMSRRRSR